MRRNRLWTALTDSGKLAKWITENDFKPVAVHRFQFRLQPAGNWNGIVDGEVLAVEPPNRLSYTWASGEEKHTVTWTLKDLGDGRINLHLEQSGISTVQGLEGAKWGWTNWYGKLGKALEQ
ncbi:SRPBCC family protein [Paenibacillus humicola]|uniref:SRPBCC family protein n=1 Tax=Paenibacillus humicola TaxID=3110540 RepID=UPI00237A72C3|nr:SRPBCC domain-containing protein [Paenibacillus humicola]